MKRWVPWLFAAAFAAAAIVAIAIGFAVIGSPGQIRARRLDERKLFELRNLASTIGSYRRSHDRLPESLAVLAQAGTAPTVAHGPYDYRPTGPFSYQLCADFATSVDQSAQSGLLDLWNHGAGHVCFTRDAR